MDPDLAALLTDSGLEAIAPILMKNDVSHLSDAAALSAEDCKEMGLSIGQRNRFLKAAASASAAVPTAATRATGLVRQLSGAVKSLVVTPPPPELATFLAAFEKYSTASKAERDKLYKAWDYNANGYVSLAEAGAGIKAALVSSTKDHRKGEALYKRFYPSYIRAFNDAKDASGDGAKKPAKASRRRAPPTDDDYVTRDEFRLLLVYLGIYATWFEVFVMVDGGSSGVTADDDKRLSRREWKAALSKIVQAGNSWAPYVALCGATEASFDEMDTNRGGFITLTEFCEWCEQAEKAAGTQAGKELAVGE